MCGIFGVFNNDNQWQKKLLAIRNELRGNGSVGFLADGVRFRIPESISDAIVNRRIPDVVWKARAMMGHTRGPSTGVGGVSKANTHPFKVGKITGAHNGYINNWEHLKRVYAKDHPEVLSFNVDSQMIFFLIDQKGIEGLRELAGWAGCWWVNDDVPDHVYLWISDAQLSVSEYAKGKLAAFSSTSMDLKLAGFKDVSVLKDDGQIVDIDLGDMSYHLLATIPASKVREKNEWKAGTARNVYDWNDFSEDGGRPFPDALPQHYRGGVQGPKKSTGTATSTGTTTNTLAEIHKTQSGRLLSDAQWSKRIWSNINGKFVFPGDPEFPSVEQSYAIKSIVFAREVS